MSVYFYKQQQNMPILTVRIGIFYEEFMCSVRKPNEIKKILIFSKGSN